MSMFQLLGMVEHINAVATIGEVEVQSTLLTNEMVTDVIVLARVQTDIVCSRLDLAWLKGDILLISLATVNNDTIIT